MEERDLIDSLLDGINDGEDIRPDQLDESHFFQIPANSLSSDQTRDFDLFVQQSGKFVLFRSREMEFTAKDIEALSQRGNRTLFVLIRDRSKYYTSLESSLSNIILDVSIPLDERSATLYDASRQVMKDLYLDLTLPANMKRTRSIIDSYFQFLELDSEALASLLLLDNSRSDQIDLQINSCICTAGISLMSQIASQKEAQDLCLGSLLKDASLIQAPGNDSAALDFSLEVVQQHPRKTIKMLQGAEGISDLVRDSILTHHELLDGTGFPRGLIGNEISLSGRIASVTDIYNTLTARSPVGKGLGPYQALMLMRNEYGQKVDQDVLRQLIMTLKG